MSLNGLDNPTVLEAYQIALTEAGGWFLLRYVSRDEIALHERGTGGVPDVRNAIESYEESSPLYGFLHYRRRKVVLSYLPEDLSRLVRARTTVQFKSVLDKFSPHDTVFSLSQPSELTESALSSACLLHTASGSITSSSSSLRRRRLMEIAEDAEESPAKDTVQTQAPAQDARQQSFSQVSEATVVPPSIASTAPQGPNGDTSVPTSPDDDYVNGLSHSVSADPRPASSRDYADDLSLAPSESRQSTQSARPSIRDLERAAGIKPKVKLGPRPSVDGSGRPRTAGNLARSVEQRPVASLPAGMRASPFRKSNPSLARPRSHGNPVATLTAKVPPVPPLLVPPSSMSISRPQLSPGAKSLSALSTSSTSNEKERLMKALQLRKSQMQKRAQAAKQTQPPNEDISNATQDANDDLVSLGLHFENQKYTKGRQRLSSISEHDNKGPLSMIQPENQQADSRGIAGYQGQAKDLPGPTEEETVVEKDNDQSDYMLPRTTYSPADPGSIRDEEIAEGAVLSAPETDPIQGEPTGSTGNDIKCGTGSSSAIIDVPLEDNSQNPPDLGEEEIIPPRPPVDEETFATNENEVVVPADTDENVHPQSILQPKSPVSETRSASVTDSSTIITSNLVDLQNEPTPEVINLDQENATIRKERRRPALEPIQVPTPDYSDDDSLSDDSFMEELKSATVEEAKPISVGKSPLSPGYSNGGNVQSAPDAWRNSRAVSNPSAIGHQFSNTPTFATGRSVSSPFSPAENPTGPVLVAKKINVSSGISKRIKALEQFSSSRDGPATPAAGVSNPTAASFESLRKRASISYGGGNSEMPRLSPEPFSRAASLRRPDSRASTNTERPASSVSVTARIVREPIANGNELNRGTEPGLLNLQASPLTVETGILDESSSRNSTPESIPNKEELRSKSASPANVPTDSPKPPSAAPPRSDSRLSGSSKNDGYFLSRSPSETSASSPEEKRESRASRLLRRMSSLTSPTRRSIASSRSPAVKEEEEESMPSVSKGPKNTVELPATVDIGEVNVQFPDTLLWKRRFIRIDSQGFLVLTPGNVDSSNRNMIKRYHLSEFRTPCIPDEERQELSNSILLDFLDGSTLQCACESRQGQAFVLQTLVDAHSTHQQLVSK
ncbi:hypothetical protein BDW74DRAFT_153596 [Aspergillus multicolor]|uniref:putative GPI-anchored cell surface glycoprotein n=1 Tax=Aspergillus multicolor TaxID=41759 RepID=UPI003CCCD006